MSCQNIKYTFYQLLNEHADVLYGAEEAKKKEETTAAAKEEEIEDELTKEMDALKKKLEVLTNIPKKKYPYPMTAA